MKYVQPHGIADPDAPYINGDPSIGRMGSIPPAAAFEHPMRELVAVIDHSMLVPDEEDLEQVATGVRSQRMNYAEDTGSANVLSVAFDPPLAAYSIGFPMRVKVHASNTGPATIDAGAGRAPIRKPTGAEMAAGDLPAGGLAELVYDGTVFQLINYGGAGGGGGTINNFLTNIPYCVDTSPTANTVIANFSPAVTTLVPGTILMVKIANTNNTFANINVNGLGLKAIFAQGGNATWPLLPGDMAVGDVLIFTYDGTRFWIYANSSIGENVTLNVSTTAQVNSLFVALGRKRIMTSGSVLIQMAIGIYGGFHTYHADADRITVQGTMKGANVPPVTGDFSATGSSPAARANDSALNIIMLRTKYGTEIQFNNADPPTAGPGMAGIQHDGPGTITFRRLLLVGQNAHAGASASNIAALGSAAGGSVKCYECTVWGSGGQGFHNGGGTLQCWNCFAVGNWLSGFVSTANGTMALTGGASYGNNNDGLLCAVNSLLRTYVNGPYAGFQSYMNGGSAIESNQGSFVYLTAGYASSSGSTDLYATDSSFIGAYSSSIGTTSPAANTEGNFMSMVRVA